MHVISDADLLWADRVIMSFRTRKSIDRDDVRAYGLEGLVKAAIRFDASRGKSFRQFAKGYIWHGIQDGLRQMELLTRTQHNEADDEKRALFFRRAYATIRLDEPIDLDGDGETISWFDMVADPNAPDPVREFEQRELREILERAIQRLSGTQQFAIGMIWFGDMNMKEIAELEGVSVQAINHRIRSAFEYLREWLHPQVGELLIAA
jgi:RNA polymerase sigma factor FliA